MNHKQKLIKLAIFCENITVFWICNDKNNDLLILTPYLLIGFLKKSLI